MQPQLRVVNPRSRTKLPMRASVSLLSNIRTYVFSLLVLKRDNARKAIRTFSNTLDELREQRESGCDAHIVAVIDHIRKFEWPNQTIGVES